MLLSVPPPPPPMITGTVMCEACPVAPIYVLAYAATDRYQWPWWDVYGFLRFLHDAKALDAMRPAPLAMVRLERPGPFQLSLPPAQAAFVFALLDADGDGPERGPSGVDWVGRFPRNPVAADPGPLALHLYPQIWGDGFARNRYAPVETAPSGLAFTDVSEASGLDFRHCQGGDLGHLPVVVGSGALLDDLDGDFDLDLVAVQGRGACPGASRNTRLYGNDGSGRFRDLTDHSGLDVVAAGMGVVGGDIDRDGDLDLYVTTSRGGRLFRNDGGLRFVDVTAAAGVGNGERWGVGATFGDVDGDGWLDLYVANYVAFSLTPPFTPDAQIPAFITPMLSSPFAFPAVGNVLYRNLGGGRFSVVADAAGALDPEGKGMAATLVDLDRDGDLDLYVTNDCTKDRLFENHAGTFRDVSTAARADDVASGMGIAVGDTDGDGLADLFSPHWLNEPPVFYRNRSQRGRLLLDEQTGPAGLAAGGNGMTGWAAEFFDADNDGDLDLLVTNGHTHPGASPTELEAQPLQLYRNDGGRFTDVSCVLAAVAGGVYRGAAAGDIDGDGDLDLYLVAWNGRGRLLRNDAPKQSWLHLHLARASGEVGALGTTVELVDSSGRRQVRQVVSGSSYLSHSSLSVEFGLGREAAMRELTVVWPGGQREHFAPPPASGAYRLVEGTGELERTP